MIKQVVFRVQRLPLALALTGFWTVLAVNPVLASDLDHIGVTTARLAGVNLDGSGVKLAHAEAQVGGSPPAFEVNPAAISIGSGKIMYYVGPPTASTSQSSTAYPNSIGADSSHADGVAGLLYGPGTGASTNLAHVDNYEGSYFFNTVIPTLHAINDQIVNQSFIASGVSSSQQKIYDSSYDNYAASFNALFVSAVGNSGAVSPPSTCYNGISVGAYGGGSSVGPTIDNGRAKPDITAPEAETSYSTPLVSGAAALLAQAGARGDGGSYTNSATDPRMLKALLLNGAIKPLDWANPRPSPLDPRYGAGVLNFYNSYIQLTGGKHAFIESGTVTTNAAHPPLGNTNNISKISGWDFNTNTSSTLADGVNHYYFNLSSTNKNAPFTATMTLVWNRQSAQTAINNLDLFLYNTVSGSLVASSTSTVDNVEHIFAAKLPAGRYDLQVLKHGGTIVSASETYALAFEFFQESLSIAKSGTNLVLTWPVYPDGFVLQTAASLQGTVTWSSGPASVITNNQNVVTLPASTGNQFFRLIRP